jgi:hypothetical protein
LQLFELCIPAGKVHSRSSHPLQPRRKKWQNKKNLSEAFYRDKGERNVKRVVEKERRGMINEQQSEVSQDFSFSFFLFFLFLNVNPYR